MKNCKKEKANKKKEQSKIANREKTLCKKTMWLHICLGFLILHQTQCSGVDGEGRGGREGGREVWSVARVSWGFCWLSRSSQTNKSEKQLRIRKNQIFDCLQGQKGNEIVEDENGSTTPFWRLEGMPRQFFIAFFSVLWPRWRIKMSLFLFLVLIVIEGAK